MKFYQWRFLLVTIVLIVLSYTASSAPSFPKLTGRVVDNANMLDSVVEQRIIENLSQHENTTTNQVVVVTLNNLDGYSIEEYGVDLGRHWGIGQKEKNNGVLLIIAKQERKVRIEVGYGLEGTLTDAISANIINTVIVPQFKKGQFSSGIENGASAILLALGGQYKENDKNMSSDEIENLVINCFILFMIILYFLIIKAQKHGYLLFIKTGTSDSEGGYSGGGGFSGGGGSFGGGGASGGW